MLQERHKRILSLIQYNWQRFLAAIMFLLVISATSPIIALLVKPMMDDIFIKKDLTKLVIIPIGLMIIYAVRGVSSFGHAYFMSYIGQSIVRRLRNSLYERITGLSIAFFHKEKTGVLMSRVTNDVNIVRAMVSMVVTRIIRDFFTIIGLVMVIFYRDWQMALIAIVVLPIVFFPIFIFGKKVRKTSKKVQESMADLTAFLHETFAGNKIVKAFGMEDYEKDRFYKKTDHLFKKEMKVVVAKEISSPAMEIVTGIGIAFVIWFGGSRVINEVITVGEFFSFMTAAFMLYEPVRKLNKVNNMIQEGLAATDRIFDIIEMESSIKEDENPIEIKPVPHSLSFKNVSFKYDEDIVLHDINLEVKQGEVLALAGMSGGGKSSMVNLIPRFYDVSEGAILVDDIDLKRASISSLRAQIAIVTQEPILFNDSVKSNIAYGNPEASDREIEQAAKAAYAYDFIQGFPQKF
jgi:subfamily B ATP-binding cassette protein MsbA